MLRGRPICAPGLAIARSELEALRQPVLVRLTRLSQAYPAVTVWDPFPVLCPGAVCSAFDDAGPLLFDGDHISAHANRLLYPDFRRLLNDISARKADGGR